MKGALRSRSSAARNRPGRTVHRGRRRRRVAGRQLVWRRAAVPRCL